MRPHSSETDPPLLRTAAQGPLAVSVEATPGAPDAALQPIAGVPGAFTLAPLLTPAECEGLIAATEALGYLPKRSRRAGPPIRTNERLLYQASAALIDALAARLRPHLAAIDVSSVGPWRLCAGSDFLNDRWRMNRYRAGEQFFPHFDTGYALGRDRRSLLSVIVYLNDDFAGGETVFFPDGQRRDHMLPGDCDAQEVRVQPRPGTALIFHHFGPLNPRHSGLPPLPGGRPKYVIRTDVFYERPPLPASSLLFGRDPALRRCVLLLGPPGAGKSTQLRRAAAALGYAALDFGHCVRSELARGGDLAARLQQARQRRAALQDAAFGSAPAGRRPGGWLPDALCCELVEHHLQAAEAGGGADSPAGFLLDGFPRMRSQSNFLEGSRWFLLAAIHLKLDEETQRRRLRERSVDPRTGQPLGAADALADTAVRRPEDTPESLAARMLDWERDTRPLVEHYAKRGAVTEVDAAGSPDAITAAILTAVWRGLREEATARFPAELRALLGDAVPEDENRASRPDALVFRYARPAAPALYLKLAPPWGAPLAHEADFLRSPAAARFGLPVPVCLGFRHLGDVACLVTEEMPGTSAKQAARASESDDARHRLVGEFAAALKRIHATPPRTPAPAALRTPEALVATAAARLQRHETPLRNFAARYAPARTLTGRDELAAELARLAEVARRLPAAPAVTVHGDACLPNFRVDAAGVFSGCLDLAATGVGDAYGDLAPAHWSVRHNLGERWAEAFLVAYAGDAIDRERLQFFADLHGFLA